MKLCRYRNHRGSAAGTVPRVSRSTRYLTWALGLAVPVVLAITVGMAVAHSPAERAEATPPATTAGSPLPAAQTPVHTWPPFSTWPLPRFAQGSPVGPAADALRAAGADVHVVDARAWDREVQPDWALCTQGETYWGDSDTPTGDVTLAAVPVGGPCP